MKNKFFKVFFSKKNECDWLNEMGKQGYLLSKVSDSQYYFSHSDDHKYSYSIENIGVAQHSEEADLYFKSRESAGIVPVLVSGSWVYFVATDSIIKQTPAIYKNNADIYFWRSMYLMFFAMFGAIICGYQAFAAGFLTRADHGSDGYIGLLTIEQNGNAALNMLKEWLNAIIEGINNNYLNLFVEKFGASDACIVLGALIPVVIVLFVLFSLNLNEYIEYHMMEKGKKSAFAKFDKKVKKHAK